MKLLLSLGVVFSLAIPAYAVDAGPKPRVTRVQIKEILKDQFKNPYSVRDLRISDPYITGPDPWGKYHWMICASYIATNSFGGAVRGQTDFTFRDGSLQDVHSFDSVNCPRGKRMGGY